MANGRYCFDRFCLDPTDRQLRRDNEVVELNARYLDALALLVREQGRLVSKNRFLDEVWRGVPVTDEALTQCIRTLRRQLGDSAAHPRFIATVPKHGYRFIAATEWVEEEHKPNIKSPAAQIAPNTPAPYTVQQCLLLGGAGTMGGGVAGVIGGLFFGSMGVAQTLQSGLGAISVLLVLLSLTVLLALVGGAGVAFGIALAGLFTRWEAMGSTLGGAAGGWLVGAVVKLLGLDAFHLLLGQSPGDITGAAEGALLGGAVGFGAWLGTRGQALSDLWRSVGMAAFTGGSAGIVIVLLGGRLMAGSLDLLVRHFPGSRFRLDQVGSLLGEDGFGPISQTVIAGLEGAVFSACIAGAMVIAHRFLARQG